MSDDAVKVPMFARTRAGKTSKLVLGEWHVPKPKRSAPFNMASRRLKEVDRLLAYRYGGPIIPGVIGDIEIMLSLFARYEVADRDWLMHTWLDLHAPWLDDADREQLIAEAKANPTKWTARTLGDKLGLTVEERTLLDIRAFRAVGMTRKVQRQLRKERDCQRKRNARRGAHKPQSQSTERQAPWIAKNISRRTWYRQQKAKSHYIADKVVSPPLAPTE